MISVMVEDGFREATLHQRERWWQWAPGSRSGVVAEGC